MACHIHVENGLVRGKDIRHETSEEMTVVLQRRDSVPWSGGVAVVMEIIGHIEKYFDLFRSRIIGHH